MPPRGKVIPPEKKAKRSLSPNEPEDPLEYANYIREGAGKRFNKSIKKKKNVNFNIEQNIREIRALLKINDEIFERCMSAEWTYGRHDKTLVMFTRYGFEVVKVRPSGTLTQFITKPECSKKEFDMKPLSDLPAGIDDLFVVKYQAEPYTMFIDYKAFFECAIMLNDEILEPFLAKLKFHIESIHVCLGEIEEWLLEPKSNIDFIEETFGVELDIPTVDDITVECACPTGTHPSSELCTKCGLQFGSHHRESYYGSYYYYSCPSSSVSYTTTTFHCTKYVVLKECNESGKFEKTFAIAEKSEQKKLKKFLEFLSSS